MVYPDQVNSIRCQQELFALTYCWWDVHPSKIQANHGRMEAESTESSSMVVSQKVTWWHPPREFHKFSKLPMEIQFKIWDIDRSPVRHYLYATGGKGLTFYGAFDCETKSFSPAHHTYSQSSEHRGHLDLQMEQILIPGKVDRTRPPEMAAMGYEVIEFEVFMGRVTTYRPSVHGDGIVNEAGPGYAWVTMKEDIFILGSGEESSGKLACLQNRDSNSQESSCFESNHLTTKIRRLGIPIRRGCSWPMFDLGPQWCEADIRTLSKMTSLQEVLLIIQCDICRWRGRDLADEYGLIYNFEKSLSRCHHIHYEQCTCSSDSNDVFPPQPSDCIFAQNQHGRYKAEMTDRLAKAGIPHVKVNVVIDAELTAARLLNQEQYISQYYPSPGSLLVGNGRLWPW
ncbi:hypothetical protein PFICI_13989 [Pestalotiopsis fici W106-1]|uniref:Uncharacterized protein n=1 Tax=Pestalotiopsis fici (strain W106-1 / CGMCC3.15140) TaxID=1229662 RepID=W3WJS7_PESFW|nr:uncharacterized protein PFICI_13989 [Pestalotiopsis fici W106-1]ETS74123.1 hypothetical protein PFICI_13989 [Pestalotiopsis fici W106-1]